MKLSSLSLISLVFLVGCTPSQNTHQLDLVPKTFQDLPGWDQDSQTEAIVALKNSCSALLKKSDSTKMITTPQGDGTVQDWKSFCNGLNQRDFQTPQDIRTYLEEQTSPYQLTMDGCDHGTFTGYYIPILKGSRSRHGVYQTPLYRLPGKGIKYKIPRNKIVKGALSGKKLEIVWVDDPIEAFFVQIQGTGRVRLENGEELRLSMAGQNGYPYYAIGKTLIDRGILTPETTSMQSIKSWLRNNPGQAETLMSENESYVFFKESPWTGDVVGSQNVPLTPQRSMAVDRSYISLGTPLWLDATSPSTGHPPLQRLLVAQDTGGAIKGAVRGDYYWGVGDEAAESAGHMNAQGSLYVLLPKR